MSPRKQRSALLAVASLALVSAASVRAEGAPQYALTIYSSAEPGRLNPQTLAQYGQAVPGYALVRDRRALAIGAPIGEVRFSDVATRIDPSTVSFASLTDPSGTRVIEQNYQFDLVDGHKLLQRYIGQKISVDQTQADRFERVSGTLLSASNGLILQKDNGEVLTLGTPAEVQAALGCDFGSVGPVDFPGPVIADQDAAALADFVCGANANGYHLTGVNFGRDLPEPDVADIRNVVAGEPAPDGSGPLAIARGIEVGHVFKLGTVYSEKLACTVLDENGRDAVMTMGCYGIGVSRVVAAAIEQNHDERGIVWPQALAPFEVALVPINLHKSPAVAEAAEKLYAELTAAGVDVLLDDRPERPGVMFADMDLIGIPHRLVIGERGLKDGLVEYKSRRAEAAENIPLAEATGFIRTALAGLP